MCLPHNRRILCDVHSIKCDVSLVLGVDAGIKFLILFREKKILQGKSGSMLINVRVLCEWQNFVIFCDSVIFMSLFFSDFEIHYVIFWSCY